MRKYNKLGKGLMRKKKSSFGKKVIILLWYIVPCLFLSSLSFNVIFISKNIESKKKAANKIHQISTDKSIMIKSDSTILKVITSE